MYYLIIFTILYGLLPQLLFFFKRQKLNSEVKFMFPYILLVFIASLYEFFGTFLLHLNVKYWFIVYELLASFALFYFFYTLLKKSSRTLFYLYIFLFVFVTINAAVIWTGHNFFEINSYFNLLQTFFVITFSVIWIKRMFISLEIDSFTSSSTFYFISGLILYYSGTVFLFLLSSLLLNEDKSSFGDCWIINIVLNLALRTLLLIGIWKGQMK